MLRRWRRKSGSKAASVGDAVARSALRDRALRRELDRARMERDILEKPSAYLRRCGGDVRFYRAAWVSLTNERRVPPHPHRLSVITRFFLAM